MKELDIRVDDTLYWADQEWECKEVDESSYLKYLMENKKNGEDCWFTKYGQDELGKPPVLSFTPYSIENGGATFERPKEPLKPIDTSLLRKVRYKDKDTEWIYGYFVGYTKKGILYKCMDKTLGIIQLWELCEPYEWTNEEAGL